MAIVPFNSAHLQSFFRSAKTEGWITSQQEMAFLLRAYPDGCLVYLLAGEPAAFITAIWYVKSAWIGNLLVMPEYREQGIGRTLLEKVLAGLDACGCETVWLTASVAGAHLYKTRGFVPLDAIQRWKGSGRLTSQSHKPDHAVAAKIDCLGWGDNRRAIFAALPQSCRWFSAHDGFLLCSPVAGVQQIGPWGARSQKTAGKLFDAIAGNEGPTAEIVLDVPEKNRVAGELLAARKFSVFGTTLLMYRGKVPGYRPEFIYSCASMGSYG